MTWVDLLALTALADIDGAYEFVDVYQVDICELDAHVRATSAGMQFHCVTEEKAE